MTNTFLAINDTHLINANNIFSIRLDDTKVIILGTGNRSIDYSFDNEEAALKSFNKIKKLIGFESKEKE